jgi:hypothetical protein
LKVFLVGQKAELMKKEYDGSVGLIILGENLDPPMISKALGMRPAHWWKRGEFTLGKFKTKSKHKYGGWKKYPPASTGKKLIEDQLLYWANKLKTKRQHLKRFREEGCRIYLDVFATTDATISMIWPAKLTLALAGLEVDVHFSVFAHEGKERL